jgi:hypothetical protein
VHAPRRVARRRLRQARSARSRLGCAPQWHRRRVRGVTPSLRAVYDELLERAAQPPFAERARALRERFLSACGRLDPGHAEAGTREAAAWEDALVRGGLAYEIAAQLGDPSEKETARSFGRAQRGLFVFSELDDTLIAADLWSQAQFIVLAGDDIGRELAAAGRRAESPLCQARLLASPAGCAVLPGTVFHPLQAEQHVQAVLAAGRARRLPTDVILDALLRMEHTWHTLSRVKVAYAYRIDLVPPAGTVQ